MSNHFSFLNTIWSVLVHCNLIINLKLSHWTQYLLFKTFSFVYNSVSASDHETDHETEHQNNIFPTLSVQCNHLHISINSLYIHNLYVFDIFTTCYVRTYIICMYIIWKLPIIGVYAAGHMFSPQFSQCCATSINA